MLLIVRLQIARVLDHCAHCAAPVEREEERERSSLSLEKEALSA